MTHTMKIRVHPRKRMEVYVDGAHFKTFENESFDRVDVYEVEYEWEVYADHSVVLTQEEKAEEEAKKQKELKAEQFRLQSIPLVDLFLDKLSELTRNHGVEVCCSYDGPAVIIGNALYDITFEDGQYRRESPT